MKKWAIASLILALLLSGCGKATYKGEGQGKNVVTDNAPEIVTQQEKPEPEKIEKGNKIQREKKKKDKKEIYDAKRKEYAQRIKNIRAEAKSMEENEASQADMNTTSYNIYLMWDALLNEIYGYLKAELPADEFKKLEKEEMAWVAEKEAAILAEGEYWGQGTMRPLAENSVAIEYTVDRIYELIDYIPER